MHVEDAMLLTDLADLSPCDFQESMRRVSRLVELGVLELVAEDEPLLRHPLPPPLRSMAPANLSQVKIAPARVAHEKQASIAPSPPFAATRVPAVAEPPRAPPDAYEDAPPTGVRLRFEVDPLSARRALLGAVVLERRRSPGAVETTGYRRVRRRAPGTPT
jgi:hypothetical protein